MVVAIARAELHIPAARSLKEKRKVIRSLVDRISHRHRASVAETAYHDLHQRAEIGIALVGADARHLIRLLEGIRGVVESVPDAQLTDWEQELIEAAP